MNDGKDCCEPCEMVKKPVTPLEVNALKRAKETVIEKAVYEKEKAYQAEFKRFISLEDNARSYRKMADELKAKLNVSKADLKEIFGE